MIALASVLLAVAPLEAESTAPLPPPRRRSDARVEVVVGSKAFTESLVLGEMLALLLRERVGLDVRHEAGLGGTLVCQRALVAGEIDLYAEYTGTAWAAVLGMEERPRGALFTFLDVARRYRAEFDVEWLAPFGFENTYVLAMRRERAQELGIRVLSDLRSHPELRAGFSHEFLERADGYVGLAEAYELDLAPRGIEHALAYDALARGDLDVVDAYSTDGKLARLDLLLLRDDRDFFPPYHAAPVVRGVLLREHPQVRSALDELAFRIDAETMMRLNGRVEGGEEASVVARDALVALGLLDPSADVTGATGATGAAPVNRRTASLTSFVVSRLPDTLRLGLEHVLLSAVSVLLAALVAVPLGTALAMRPGAERWVLGAAGVVQTVPSLALLAVLVTVPGLGLSARTAVVALFLYSLLPILRNTVTGIRGTDPALVDAARAIGLRESEILRLVRFPLATGAILAGVRTAAVIAVGVATLAAFVGAGGLGEPIVTGLYLSDQRLIASGAIPAALLALVADAGLARIERWATPRGMRDRERPS